MASSPLESLGPLGVAGVEASGYSALRASPRIDRPDATTRHPCRCMLEPLRCPAGRADPRRRAPRR
jgi:hypothetical protein